VHPERVREFSPLSGAALSKLERRADMYVSTLQDFVKAMGEELKITAKFPEGTAEMKQFEGVRKQRLGRIELWQ
jgi:hypothetical protein